MWTDECVTRLLQEVEEEVQVMVASRARVCILSFLGRPGFRSLSSRILVFRSSSA
jgi:hypothetical protein